MRLNFFSAILVSSFLLSCNESEKKIQETEASSTAPLSVETKPKFQNKGHELVYEMTQKVGDYKVLLEKKDVVYTYTYQTPDGKMDISTEKYIFDGELSYGALTKHERTLPDFEGVIEQGYDGNEYWLKHGGVLVNDEKALKRVAFSRPTNFYWFAMMPKLTDPNLNYELLEDKVLNGKKFGVVKVTFNTQGDKPTDIYQLYINEETGLVDQFLFTVADFGKMEKPFLMQLKYEEVDGMLIPSKRKYKASTWDAEVSDEPWVEVTWTDIAFDNGLTAADFKK